MSILMTHLCYIAQSKKKILKNPAPLCKHHGSCHNNNGHRNQSSCWKFRSDCDRKCSSFSIDWSKVDSGYRNLNRVRSIVWEFEWCCRYSYNSFCGMKQCLTLWCGTKYLLAIFHYDKIVVNMLLYTA